MTASARIELRVDPAVKARLELAADYDEVSVSAFIVSAVEQRVAEVLRRHTSVSADFFDALIDELDRPAAPNEALVRAVRAARSASS